MPLEPVDQALALRVPAEAEVHHVVFPENMPRVARWALGKSVWLPLALAEVKRIIGEKRPDVVLTSGPPHLIHVLGWAVKRLYRVPWIADFRDPWVFREIGSPSSLRRRIGLAPLEKLTFRVADRIIANANNAEKLYRSVHPRSARRLVTLTNGFDPRPKVRPEIPVGKVVRLLYAGEIYAGRDPLPLIDAILALNHEWSGTGPALEFRVIGRVDQYRAKHADALGSRSTADCVHFEGQLPHAEALAEMDRAHVNVLLDTPGRRVGVPAKLYEYLGARRPVLALCEEDSDAAKILADSGILHRVVRPGDYREIRQALVELVAALKEGADAALDSERWQAYTRAHIAASLSRLLTEVAAHPEVR